MGDLDMDTAVLIDTKRHQKERMVRSVKNPGLMLGVLIGSPAVGLTPFVPSNSRHVPARCLLWYFFCIPYLDIVQLRRKLRPDPLSVGQ